MPDMVSDKSSRGRTGTWSNQSDSASKREAGRKGGETARGQGTHESRRRASDQGREGSQRSGGGGRRAGSDR